MTQNRASVYEKLFGEPSRIVEGPLEDVPRIDVHVYPPRMGPHGLYEGHHTLVTSGMADRAFTFPPDSNPAFHRCELVMYVSAPEEEHIRLLHFLAHYPHRARRYYVFGHTIPNAEPFFHDSALSVALLLYSLVRWHAQLPELFQVEGQRVELLWVQPITPRELELKRSDGIDALLDLFARHRLPLVLDERRPSLA